MYIYHSTGEISLHVLPAIFGFLWSLRSTPFERVEKLRVLFTTAFGGSNHLDISFDDFVKARKHRMANISEEQEKPNERDFLTPYGQKYSYSEEFARCVYEVVSCML